MFACLEPCSGPATSDDVISLHLETVISSGHLQQVVSLRDQVQLIFGSSCNNHSCGKRK